jgi:hypothetical protein
LFVEHRLVSRTIQKEIVWKKVMSVFFVVPVASAANKKFAQKERKVKGSILPGGRQDNIIARTPLRRAVSRAAYTEAWYTRVRRFITPRIVCHRYCWVALLKSFATRIGRREIFSSYVFWKSEVL